MGVQSDFLCCVSDVCELVSFTKVGIEVFSLQRQRTLKLPLDTTTHGPSSPVLGAFLGIQQIVGFDVCQCQASGHEEQQIVGDHSQTATGGAERFDVCSALGPTTTRRRSLDARPRKVRFKAKQELLSLLVVAPRCSNQGSGHIIGAIPILLHWVQDITMLRRMPPAIASRDTEIGA